MNEKVRRLQTAIRLKAPSWEGVLLRDLSGGWNNQEMLEKVLETMDGSTEASVWLISKYHERRRT